MRNLRTVALKHNDRKVWLKVQYLVIWYPLEYLIHLYKSCLSKLKENWSQTFDEPWFTQMKDTKGQYITVTSR